MQSLTFLSYPKSQSTLFNPASQIHLISNIPTNFLILTSQPTAYCFTKTALLYIHDHLINALASQVQCFCLLNLYAASTPLTMTSQLFASRLVPYSWLLSQLLQVLLVFSSLCVNCDNNNSRPFVFFSLSLALDYNFPKSQITHLQQI